MPRVLCMRCIISYKDSAVRFFIAESVSPHQKKRKKKRMMVRRGLHHFLTQHKGFFVLSFNSSLVGWCSWSRKGCNFPTYLPTGSGGVLGGRGVCHTLWLFGGFFPSTFAEEIFSLLYIGRS